MKTHGKISLTWWKERERKRVLWSRRDHGKEEWVRAEERKQGWEKLRTTSILDPEFWAGSNSGKHHFFSSPPRFIGSASRTKALWRGTWDELAANITVELQFYLRESSFIKSHDWIAWQVPIFCTLTDVSACECHFLSAVPGWSSPQHHLSLFQGDHTCPPFAFKLHRAVWYVESSQWDLLKDSPLFLFRAFPKQAEPRTQII